MIDRIECKGENIALILRTNYEPEGISFITARENPIQLGVLKHQRGAKIKAHFHKKTPRTVNEIQEVLHLEYGKVEVEFYDSVNGAKIQSAILYPGDTLLLLSGGHGFNILADSKLIEVKQGPYYGVEQDKELI